MDRRNFLITAGASLAASTFDAACQASGEEADQPTVISAVRRPHRPNVVIIICDDLGYGDLGCYGSKIATSNINRLAENGVRFTNHSTPFPLCSASRAALLTGQYPARVGVPGVFFPLSENGMSLSATTIANVLKDTHYKTMAIGKWHLGDLKQYMPTNRGFDEFYGVPYSVDMDPLPLVHNTEILEPEADRDLLTQRYTKQAVDFIHRSKEGPFFLYFAQSYPHIPLHASKYFRGKSQLGMYGDVVGEIDWSVGEVVQALKSSGVEENTLVFFTSDHGPWFQGSTGGLRGRKAWTYEGGVRIPMIASMPGVLPRNQTASAPTSHMDMLPTLAKLCGGTLPAAPLDGTDIWTLLDCEQQSIERKALLSFSGLNVQCARSKQWKLHISRGNTPPWVPSPKQGAINYSLRHPELYNLIEDPEESYDIASEHPEIVAAMQKDIDEQLATLPDDVKQSYAKTQQHVTNPWMPADSWAEEMDAGGYNPSPLNGAKTQEVLQRFNKLP